MSAYARPAAICHAQSWYQSIFYFVFIYFEKFLFENQGSRGQCANRTTAPLRPSYQFLFIPYYLSDRIFYAAPKNLAASADRRFAGIGSLQWFPWWSPSQCSFVRKLASAANWRTHSGHVAHSGKLVDPQRSRSSQRLNKDFKSG
jgi:hypothetical protein